MAFCMNCGAKLKEGVKFCSNCGTPVEELPPTPEESTIPEPASQEAAPQEPAPQEAAEEGGQTTDASPSTSALDKVIPAVESAVAKLRPAVKSAAEKVKPAVESVVEKAKPAVESAVEKAKPAVESAVEKVKPTLKRHYKVIGVVALAVVIILLFVSRCGGGTGGEKKSDKGLERFLGYWENGMLYGENPGINGPEYIAITENALRLEPQEVTVPMSQVEQKDDGLYFTAEWYESFPYDGSPSGNQTHELRLVFNESRDLLDLECYTKAGANLFVSWDTGWRPLNGYKPVD